MIRVRYTSVDGFRKSRTFKTIEGARAFARRYVGPTPEIGGWYAVSGDGIGKIDANVPMSALFPDTVERCDFCRSTRCSPGFCVENDSVHPPYSDSPFVSPF